jgi:hypothetical protein
MKIDRHSPELPTNIKRDTLVTTLFRTSVSDVLTS